jgi:hypothetical protein
MVQMIFVVNYLIIHRTPISMMFVVRAENQPYMAYPVCDILGLLVSGTESAAHSKLARRTQYAVDYEG